MGSEGNQDGFCTDCGEPVWWYHDDLVTRSGNRWCFGKDDSHVGMTHHHALPGMAQYVVRSPEGQVCHCLDRKDPHIHQIVLVTDSLSVSKQTWPAPIALAEPQPGDFCCLPVTGSMGIGIEAGEFLAETLQHVRGAKLQPYDHAEVYVGQPDENGPHGYTYSAYPDNGQPGVTGRRALPGPAALLPGSLWSSGIIPLTAKQRFGIISWCLDHPSVSYSWPDYAAIGLRALGVRTDRLRAYIQSTASMICSYYTDAAFNRGGGVHLFDDGRWEGYVSPGDLAVLLQSKMP